VLRRVWARHSARAGTGSGDNTIGDGHAGGHVQLRPAQGRGPGDRVESPYDTEARFRAKAGTNWTGYMVHLTETCDQGRPHLVVHADTTPANVHEAMRTEPIHDALAAKGLAPSEHLADAGYISAGLIVTAREQYRIDLVGPARPDQSWQNQAEGAFRTTDFMVNWDRQVVRCPEGCESVSWGEYKSKASGRLTIKVGFSTADCHSCPSRSRCTRMASRRLGLLPRPEYEAIAAARARLETKAGRRLYRQRQGIEGTISQSVRAFGLRRARYCGLAKVSLQSMATAAAINLDRLGAWFAERPLAPTRTSRFAAIAT
jgi:hypothetical protein